MDKKNAIIGGALVVAALLVYVFVIPKPAPATSRLVASANGTSKAPVDPATGKAPATGTQPAGTVEVEKTSANPASVITEQAPAVLTKLANDFVEVSFTDAGGAIRDVAFKKYPQALDDPAPYHFNHPKGDPILALTDIPGLDHNTRFERVSQTPTEVVYRANAGGFEITRRYVLTATDTPTTEPYRIRHETTIRNLADKTVSVSHVALALGTTGPANPQDAGQYTTTGYMSAGSTTFVTRSALDVSGGFLGIGAHDARPPVVSAAPITWATVKNQFFVSLYTPDTPASGMVTTRVKLRATLPQELENNTHGLSADLQFELKNFAPHGEARLAGNLYVGPKEYHRISNSDVFKADEEKVMQFGFFGWASKLLITLMTAIHSILPNAAWTWGLSIVLTTLTLKLIFLWPTFSAARSMRRMAKLQPEMLAIREKYKDNPQKQQAAQMELWKQHKVNPFGGCIPMLIPLPFFLGFFQMLQNTAELRLAPFLWARDLSAPDTVGHIAGIAINVLPLLFTSVTFIQMQLTPTPNADPAQARMMKFMPLVMLFIYYSFSCALSLYSLTNATFTIGQQLVINRLKDDGDPAGNPGGGATRGPGGKLTKNVTPSKKK